MLLDALRESWLYQDGVAAGLAKARAKAESKAWEVGRLNGMRTFIRLVLSQKFPAMGMLPEIDRVDRSEALDELFVSILNAGSEDDVRAAVRAAHRALKMTPQQIRRVILEQSKRANVGHIGSCLCVVEILTAIYDVLKASSPDDPDRDRFVLSKGHAALALYAVLAAKGWISDAELDEFCGDGSRIAVHPEHTVPGVDFSTGSLGQGISMAAGAALAAKLQRSPRRVYCLISDAECNEGSTWEAAMFAAQHRLGNLKVVLDWNRQQALGLTREIIDIPNLAERWRAFGWQVSEVDGHSVPELTAALAEDGDSEDKAAPHMILARTVFGKGVSYMEQGTPLTQHHLPQQPINWHYLPMSDQEFAIAMREVEAN